MAVCRYMVTCPKWPECRHGGCRALTGLHGVLGTASLDHPQHHRHILRWPFMSRIARRHKTWGRGFWRFSGGALERFHQLVLPCPHALVPRGHETQGVAQQKWGFSALFSLDIADECHWCCTFVQSLSTLTDEQQSIKWIDGIRISFSDNGGAGPTELIGVGVRISEHGHLRKRGSWVEHIPEPGPREHNYVSSGVMPIFRALRRQLFW